MRLLKARESIGSIGRVCAIMTRVLVLAAPAKALIRRLSLVVRAASMIVACSGVGTRPPTGRARTSARVSLMFRFLYRHNFPPALIQVSLEVRNRIWVLE